MLGDVGDWEPAFSIKRSQKSATAVGSKIKTLKNDSWAEIRHFLPVEDVLVAVEIIEEVVSGLYVVVEEDVGIVVGEVDKVVADEAVESETRTD